MNFYHNAIKIGAKKIGADNPCFIIAEAAANHNQSLSMAKELIAVANEAGVDAVKFQTVKFSELYLERLCSKTKKEFIKSLEVKEDWHRILKKEAEKKGLIFLSSPTYIRGVDLLFDLGLPAFKIGSSQVASDLPLIKYAASKKLPLFISTGLVSLRRVRNILDICRREGNRKIMLMHCVSMYPVPASRVSLAKMVDLKRLFNTIVGFSDHTLGIHFPVAAVSLGAKIIEKHFTLSRKMEGPDHPFSLEPEQLKEMVSLIRQIESGLPIGKGLSSQEKILRKAVQLKWIADKDFNCGENLKKGFLTARRVSGGINIERDISHFFCTKGIKKGQVITEDYLTKAKRR